jgi:cell division protein FtsW
MLSGYQVKQALVGIGQGGLFGVGLGESTQKHFFLPEPHKDFIFSIVGEEWGFVGAVLLLVLYMFLISRAWKIALAAPDEFGYFLGAGICASISLSTVINIGVTLGLLPATGQPLPLFSYGGSSLLMTMASIGILLNISKQSARAIAARPLSVRYRA